MTTKFIQNKGNTKIVAHRGLSYLERENSNAAFVAAGNRSYFGIETDVHRTADGNFVIIHDADTGRVAPVNVNVEKSTVDELSKIRLYDKTTADTRGDLCLPMLWEYASICSKYDKVAVLELKNLFTDAEIKEIVNIMAKYHSLDKTVFISFGYENLPKIRALIPDQKVQLLTDKITDELVEKLAHDKFDLDVHFKALTKEWIDKLHDKGIVVNCWTVDDPADCERLIGWGVDQITSNCCE